MDYYVPNFGKDQDILHQDEHVSQAQTILGHEWTPSRADKKDSGAHVWGSGDNRWVVPTPDGDFYLTEDDKDYNTEIHHISREWARMIAIALQINKKSTQIN